jgi:small subunit ribosomal protein S16
MVKIRLFRGGAKKRPQYRIVAVDSRTRGRGRVLEFLGTYDPLKSGTELSLRRTAFDGWVAKGARVSDSVASLIRRRERQDGDASQSADASQPAAS